MEHVTVVPDSDSEDEVFFGPMSEKEKILYARYGNRKTELFHPNFRFDEMPLPSEEYFGDVSRLSSEIEKCGAASLEINTNESSPMDSLDVREKGAGDSTSSSSDSDHLTLNTALRLERPAISPGVSMNSSNFSPQRVYGFTPFVAPNKIETPKCQKSKNCRSTFLSFQQFSSDSPSEESRGADRLEFQSHACGVDHSANELTCNDLSRHVSDGFVKNANKTYRVQTNSSGVGPSVNDSSSLLDAPNELIICEENLLPYISIGLNDVTPPSDQPTRDASKDLQKRDLQARTPSLAMSSNAGPAVEKRKSSFDDDSALGDVTLPSILAEHFHNCSVREPAVDEEICDVNPGTDIDILNVPGPSGLLPLLQTTCDSDRLTSDLDLSLTDSELEFGPEAFQMWNQQLMRMAAKPSIRVTQSPVLQGVMIKQASEPATRVEKHFQPSLPKSTSHRTSMGQGFSFGKKTGDVNLTFGPQSNPSPLVQALQLTPPRSTEQAKAPQTNLECLDLSVDERLPVESYFDIMDKENRNLKEKKSAPKKKTPLGNAPLKEIANNSPLLPQKSPCVKFTTPNPVSVKKSAKKTGIPVMEARIAGSRHARCFNFYSSSKVDELKAKSMQNWKHINSPVAQYIRDDPVPHLVQNIRPKFSGFHSEEIRLSRPLFPLPSPLVHLGALPVAKYVSKGKTPRKVEIPPAKYRYFPSPFTPVVIKHTGPSHVISDASYLHGEESLVAAAGQLNSRIPHFNARVPASNDSVWEVVSPKPPK